MYYGGDYNPEQWAPEVWREDVERMREAGVNLVTVGVFSWARIQPREGEFDWAWLDEVLDLLHEADIGVDLATATASPPPWAVESYPEMLARDERGVRYGPGSRQHQAITSPEYRRLAAALVGELAGRYASHPAVRMWHVNNELGCHVRYDYSDSAQTAFRIWLEKKYATIDRLNQVWGTAFWSQVYGSFAQVPLPRHAPYIHNPAAELDFRRFTSDAFLELCTTERDILRRAGATQPITTNFMGAFPAGDYWTWAGELDLISDDTYPDPADPDGYLEAAFTHDLMRSLKPGVPWMVMEQATEAVNSRPANVPKAPGQMAALSMQSVARGADGILFFQWRQTRRGAEKFHSAMLPHAGTDTRVWREVVQLGAALHALPALPAGPSGARIALVFQWDSRWALESPDLPAVIDYEAHVRRWHTAATRLRLAVDLVRGDEDLSGYDLVVAPSLYLVDDATTAALRGFVARGGRLLATAFTDVVDADCAFRAGGFTVALRDVLGIQVQEFGALAEGDAVVADSRFGTLRGGVAAETLAVRGADVVGRFTDGRLAGEPALTRHAYGDGQGWYLATFADDATALAVLRGLAEELGIAPLIDAPDHVTASRRGEYLTVINHGAHHAEVDIAGTDAVTGDPVRGVHLAPFGWAVVRTEPDHARLAVGAGSTGIHRERNIR